MKPGQIIYITHGSYSDYCVDGVFVVIKEFEAGAKVKEHYNYRLGNDQRRLNFATWLATTGYVAEIAAEELASDE